MKNWRGRYEEKRRRERERERERERGGGIRIKREGVRSK